MIDVTAAVIINNGKVFIARRALGQKDAGGWEFPGGKVEPAETPEECLRRELLEELGIETKIAGFITASVYEYPWGKIRLLAYQADFTGGAIRLKVHDDYRWVEVSDLLTYDLLPADIPIAQRLMETYH